jgi:hypothetical protein
MTTKAVVAAAGVPHGAGLGDGPAVGVLVGDGLG